MDFPKCIKILDGNPKTYHYCCPLRISNKTQYLISIWNSHMTNKLADSIRPWYQRDAPATTLQIVIRTHDYCYYHNDSRLQKPKTKDKIKNFRSFCMHLRRFVMIWDHFLGNPSKISKNQRLRTKKNHHHLIEKKNFFDKELKLAQNSLSVQVATCGSTYRRFGGWMKWYKKVSFYV